MCGTNNYSRGPLRPGYMVHLNLIPGEGGLRILLPRTPRFQPRAATLFVVFFEVLRIS